MMDKEINVVDSQIGERLEMEAQSQTDFEPLPPLDHTNFSL
jgi:hypothetical protein